ncbi:hypothetical protein DRQ21_09785 [Candidatus Fermentibacteria bacterium]|nr:MAG: hypothetical protein DRQ21_09785 [Candidatus Fermentibacteria bacterium]
MSFLLLLLVFCSLPVFEVSVDPDLLEELYSDPFSDREIPAVVEFESISGSCTLAFRGGSSLWCDKRSWHIRVDNSRLFRFGKHILLNAQFRDASLMRNSLGLYLTRKLGYPAPQTEFCTLSINGENKGVYERVEAIDRLFYERNGLQFGPLFKSVNIAGRLSHQYSNTMETAGYEPKVDSSPYGSQLVQLIEECFRGDISPLETNEILAAFAVKIAIEDQDAVSSNYYLHKSGGTWHYYPWDRDASFGNSWEGTYDSLWTHNSNRILISIFGPSRAILSVPENRQTFNEILGETADIFTNDLCGVVDSLRFLLRDELASDPYYEYTTAQFDSVCLVLKQDIQARADFLGNLYLYDEVPEILDFSISSCLNMQSSVEVSVSLSEEPVQGVLCLESSGNNPEQYHILHQAAPGEPWTATFDIPSGAYSTHVVFGVFGPQDGLLMFYPSWGMRSFQDIPLPSPSARIALAELFPEKLTPGPPVWCGENLWVLPVTNSSAETQDISLCRFSLGLPEGNIFIPESTLVAPGETFYLTNSFANAETVFEGSAVFGGAGNPYPGATTLTLKDPSWNSIYSWAVPEGDSLQEDYSAVIPCEISTGTGDDWIELFNFSEYTVDMSGWYFTDTDRNVSVVPEDVVLTPGELLLASVNPGNYEFCKTIPLCFNLNSDLDSLTLYSQLGDTVFSLGWNDSWPVAATGIFCLKSPWANFQLPWNWEVSVYPGTPGEINPGWPAVKKPVDLQIVSANPCSGSFSFSYTVFSSTAEAFLYDFSGRVIMHIELPEKKQGTVTAVLPRSLPVGIYFLYLKTAGGTASARITLLR